MFTLWRGFAGNKNTKMVKRWRQLLLLFLGRSFMRANRICYKSPSLPYHLQVTRLLLGIRLIYCSPFNEGSCDYPNVWLSLWELIPYWSIREIRSFLSYRSAWKRNFLISSYWTVFWIYHPIRIAEHGDLNSFGGNLIRSRLILIDRFALINLWIYELWLINYAKWFAQLQVNRYEILLTISAHKWMDG